MWCRHRRARQRPNRRRAPNPCADDVQPRSEHVDGWAEVGEECARVIDGRRADGDCGRCTGGARARCIAVVVPRGDDDVDAGAREL